MISYLILGWYRYYHTYIQRLKCLDAVGVDTMNSIPVEAALTGYGHTVSPDASATDAARTLRDSAVSILVVEDDGIEGVVTESDFVAMVAETTDPVSVSEIMSTPPVTVSPSTPLSTVVDEMRRHGVERVLIDDRDTYWGFVSTRSVATHTTQSRIDLTQVAPSANTDACAASPAGD